MFQEIDRLMCIAWLDRLVGLAGRATIIDSLQFRCVGSCGSCLHLWESSTDLDVVTRLSGNTRIQTHVKCIQP